MISFDDLGIPVSRETYERLALIENQVRRWQKRINLIAPSTVDAIWERHIRDSLQLWPLAPHARRWLDLGSGGGFPALPIAALLADVEGAHVVLVESNAKKCAFLRETIRLAQLPAEVIWDRIESVAPRLQEGSAFDVISARALASLDQLLHFAESLMGQRTVGLYPKGEDVDGEIAIAKRTWNLAYDLIDSKTEPDARIVRVLSAQRAVLAIRQQEG